MGDRLSGDDARLYRLCDEALFWLWDPIGVRGVPEARDEYYSYLPEAFRYAKSRDGVGLADYLAAVSETHIELPRDPDRIARAVKFMLSAAGWVDEHSDHQGAS